MKNFYALSVVFLLAVTLITSALAATTQSQTNNDLSHHAAVTQNFLL